jgi:phage repressor protein C with HTH and peptisase S24 domain
MRDNFVLNVLLEKGVVTWKPHGNSMTPKIYSGDQVKVVVARGLTLEIGDILYTKVKGTYYLHLLTAIDKDRYQISNNHGHVNGWVNRDNIFGICIQIKGSVLLSEEDLKKRSN